MIVQMDFFPFLEMLEFLKNPNEITAEAVLWHILISRQKLAWFRMHIIIGSKKNISAFLEMCCTTWNSHVWVHMHLFKIRNFNVLQNEGVKIVVLKVILAKNYSMLLFFSAWYYFYIYMWRWSWNSILGW